MSRAISLLLSAPRFAPMVNQAHPWIFESSSGANAVRLPADQVVKVPQMAESITEGTLKQFSKRTNAVLSILTWLVLLRRPRQY